jgi:hypothetical protein
MPGGNIGASALSARPCARSSQSCGYTSTATLPIVGGGRGRQGWGGRTAAAVDAKMIPILLGDAEAMGQRGGQWQAATHVPPPLHVNGSNDGGGSCGGAPCSLLSLSAAVAAQG